MRFVAGRGAVAKHLVRGAAVAERHRENAGRGRRGEETGSAVADSHQEDAGRGAVTKRLEKGSSVANSHREDANQHREATASGSASGKSYREDTARREMRRCEAPSGRLCPQGDALRIRIGKMLMTGSGTRKQHREATPPRKAAGKREAASVDF